MKGVIQHNEQLYLKYFSLSTFCLQIFLYVYLGD